MKQHTYLDVSGEGAVYARIANIQGIFGPEHVVWEVAAQQRALRAIDRFAAELEAGEHDGR